MTLYDIDQRLIDLIDTESGEIADMEAFEMLQMERDRKLEGIALAYKNFMAEANALGEQKKSFAEREKAALNKAEKCRKLLERGLAGQKMETPMVAVSYRKSTAVEITDLDALPFAYTVTEIKPDKERITAALKNGETVPGAELVSRQNIQIK
jgi:hypothetical protein